MKSRIVLLTATALLSHGCGERCDATAAGAGDAAHSATLTWSSSAAATTMTYDSLGDPDPRSAEVTDDGATHTASLWGLPPLSEVAYRFTDTDSGEFCTDVFISPGLESGLPQLDVTLNTGQPADRWHYIAGVAMGRSGMLFIADRRGALRWHVLHDPGLSVSTVHLEDETLYYNTFDADRDEDIGHINARPLRGERAITRTRTEGAHHTFVRLPDGALAYPAVDIRPVADPDSGAEVDVVGDRLVEIAPDGTESELWSVWDHEDVDFDQIHETDFYGDLGLDWTHANGLSYSPARDSYLISLGHIDTIYEIDRSGAVLSRLRASDVVSGAAFHFQHDPHWTEAGTLLMMSYPEDGGATAIEYAVSEDGALSEVWSYTRDNGGVTLLGEARRLPDGSTFINYGGMGELREVTAEGVVTWQLNAGIGSWFGSIILLDELPD